MDVSIIIVNYNTLKMTQECIDSIFEKTTGLDFEVILVDNASTDGSKDHFEKEKRIKYIYSDENLGFGRANDLGYEYANGDYIFFLNSDTLLLNNAIYEFFQYMESALSEVGCIGCELVDEKGQPSYSFGYFPNLKFFIGMILKEYHIRLSCFSFKPYSLGPHPISVDYSSGADLFIRRSVINQCNLFDKDFFMFFEEVEMQYRFNKNGYLSQVIDTPHISHLIGGSRKNKGKKTIRTKIIELESRYIYCRKVFPQHKYMIMSLLHLILLPRIVLYKTSWKEKRQMAFIILRNFIPNKKPSIFLR